MKFVVSKPSFSGGLMVCTLGSQAGGGVLPMMTYAGEAQPKRGLLFRLQVYKRVGISLVKVYKSVG